MSVGLLTLATVGGALDGYLWRIRQEKRKQQLPHKGQDTQLVIDLFP